MASRMRQDKGALEQGFTLIELMIVVAIIAILTGIAVPSYQEYVQKARLVDATNQLASMRAQMEQYFQDNRTYAASGDFSPPCLTSVTAGSFSVGCAATTASTYTITASGSGQASGFSYTIDQAGTQRTTALPSGWGTAPAACWITSKGGSC